MGVVATEAETGAGLVVNGQEIPLLGVVNGAGREAGIRRGADFHVGAVGKTNRVLLGTVTSFEVVPGVKGGRFALEQRVNEQLFAEHGDREGLAVVIVRVVGVAQVRPPTFRAGLAPGRRVRGGQRPVFPTDAGGGHGTGVRGVDESTVGALEIREVTFCSQRNRRGVGTVLDLEQGLVGEVGQLVVVLRIPYSRHRIRVNANLCAVLDHGRGDLHGGTGDGLTVGKVDASIDEVLKIAAVPDFNGNRSGAVGKVGDVGCCKRSEHHQHHQENWRRFTG